MEVFYGKVFIAEQQQQQQLDVSLDATWPAVTSDATCLDRDEAEDLAGVVVDDGQVAHVGGDHLLHARLDRVRALRRHHLRTPGANLLHLGSQDGNEMECDVMVCDVMVWYGTTSIGLGYISRKRHQRNVAKTHGTGHARERGGRRDKATNQA